MSPEISSNIPHHLDAELDKAIGRFPLRSTKPGQAHPATHVSLETILPSFRPKTPDAVNYQKIQELFHGIHTKLLFERHVVILEKLSRVLKSGIVILLLIFISFLASK